MTKIRIPERLSYSAMSAFESDIEDFAIRYLSPARPHREPQQKAAAVGSAFDARVKAKLHELLYGANVDPKYTYEALFEAQVESHNRDFAGPDGDHVFEQYVYSGFYDELATAVQASPQPPRFEFEVVGLIDGVPFLGKPDCLYWTPGGLTVVHDFKVNGYFGKSNTSPAKGYMLCKDGYADKKPNKSHGKAHENFKPMTHMGTIIDSGALEDCKEEWADQLSLYSYVLGCPIADPNVVLSIHQATFKPDPAGGKPLSRFSAYRSRVRKSYQELIVRRLRKCWDQINSDHIFPKLTKEESAQRMEILIGQAAYSHEDDPLFDAMTAPWRG